MVVPSPYAPIHCGACCVMNHRPDLLGYEHTDPWTGSTSFTCAACHPQAPSQFETSVVSSDFEFGGDHEGEEFVTCVNCKNEVYP